MDIGDGNYFEISQGDPNQTSVEGVFRHLALRVDDCKAAFQRSFEHNGPSVVIANRPCVLMPRKIKEAPYTVISESCNGCKLCFRIGCPAIAASKELTKKGHPKAIIDEDLCTGCTICAQVCPEDAIVLLSEKVGS